VCSASCVRSHRLNFKSTSPTAKRTTLRFSVVCCSPAHLAMSPPSPSVEALPTLAADHARSASDTPSLEKEPPDYDIEKDPGYSNDASDSKNLSKVAEVTELTPAEAFEVNVDGDESPFPEVNASVSTSDDPTSQINSTYRPCLDAELRADLSSADFRMWFFVTLTTIIFAGCNMFFSLRYVSPSPRTFSSYIQDAHQVFPGTAEPVNRIHGGADSGPSPRQGVGERLSRLQDRLRTLFVPPQPRSMEHEGARPYSLGQSTLACFHRSPNRADNSALRRSASPLCSASTSQEAVHTPRAVSSP
jgi:hypothetical protein